MNIQNQIPVWLQWAWALAGLIIAAGGFIWILGIFWPYLRWSKRMMIRSYELGEKTAAHLDQLQKDLEPVIRDLKDAVADAKGIASDLKTNELDKISKVLDKISENGKLERAFEAIADIPEKLDSILKSEGKNLLKNL